MKLLFVQLDEYLENASKLLQRVPLSFFLFKRNIQNWVRKQEFFLKTSHAYFKNYAFWALDMAPTLDVPVLLYN